MDDDADAEGKESFFLAGRMLTKLFGSERKKEVGLFVKTTSSSGWSGVEARWNDCCF